MAKGGLVLVVASLAFVLQVFARNSTILSRSKRRLRYPEGAIFSYSYCMTTVVQIQGTYIFTEALAMEMDFELTKEEQSGGGEKSKRRRDRRDIYSKIETALDKGGLPGRVCVLRAVCEATTWGSAKQNGVVQALLQLLFSMPDQAGSASLYDVARRRGFHAKSSPSSCAQDFADCPVSLLETALQMYHLF